MPSAMYVRTYVARSFCFNNICSLAQLILRFYSNLGYCDRSRRGIRRSATIQEITLTAGGRFMEFGYVNVHS